MSDEKAPIIQALHVWVPFGGRKSKGTTRNGLKDINFSLSPGSRIGLVGPSAAGKTTLGMVCAGLLPPMEGTVYHFKRNVYLSRISPFLSHHAEIQMVFQDPFSALNPRRTVRSWLRFCQRKKGLSKEEKDNKSLEYFKMVNLPEELFDRLPGQLSGGECQRVAITASILSEAKCLILDEPTNMLDSIARKQVLVALKSINEHLNTSLLLITHDLDSAAVLCENIKVIWDGSIVEEGNYNELSHSNNKLVRKFFMTNL